MSLPEFLSSITRFFSVGKLRSDHHDLERVRELLDTTKSIQGEELWSSEDGQCDQD